MEARIKAAQAKQSMLWADLSYLHLRDKLNTNLNQAKYVSL